MGGVYPAFQNCLTWMRLWQGNRMMEEAIRQLGPRDVIGIISRGGTILYTARCLEFLERAGGEQAVANLAKFGIEGGVVIGGDGAYRGAEYRHRHARHH